MASANLGLCAIVTAAALCSTAAEPAHAEFSFWRQFRPYWTYHAPARPKHQSKSKNPSLTKKVPVQERGPLQIVVSLADQRISVYDGEELIAHSSVSTGVPDHPTPSGVFSVIGKQIWHRSNLYSDAPMPYMQRITWSGIALHAGDLPGYPASHGCIRLEKSFAIRLWHLSKRGTRVIITPGDVRPVEIASPHLPAIKPKDSNPPPKTAAVISNTAMTDTAGISSLSAPASEGSTAVLDAPPTKIPARKPVPISIFVSSKSNTLSVRQGFKPLFETPVTIQDAERPLGTHVFTLSDPRREGADSRWTVVSIPAGPPGQSHPSPRRQRSAVKPMAEAVSSGALPETAGAALGRIAIPADAADRIAELLVPGSSLILSDQGMSKETGRGTDFIVETR